MDKKKTHTLEEIEGHIVRLFTVQERLAMSDLEQRGEFQHVAAALDIPDHDHAFWLQEWLDLKRPVAEKVVDSVVEKEILMHESKGNKIDSPAEAKFWQNRLDLEKAEQPLPDLEEALAEFNKNQEVLDLTKDELKERLDEAGIAYKGSMKKEELLDLLMSPPAEEEVEELEEELEEEVEVEVLLNEE